MNLFIRLFEHRADEVPVDAIKVGEITDLYR